MDINSLASMLALLMGGSSSQDARRYYENKQPQRPGGLEPLGQRTPGSLELLLQHLMQRRQPAQGPEPFQRPFRQGEP